MRKGIYKTYITHHYNDSNLRGTVDIARHIRQNTPFIGNIAYNQREFTPNNEVIKLIRHTIEFINTKNFGKQLLKNYSDQTEQIIIATPDYELNDRQKIIYKNKINPIRHAYFHEYRQLQQLCIMILEHQKHQIGKGNRHIRGVLFDGSWLWEEYINTLIKDDFIHPMNKANTGGQLMFQNNQGNKEGKIYPDFISSNPNDRIIADAKYKPADNIANKDYLQVVAYMYRFDSKKGYYIYPESNNAQPQIFHLLQGVKGIDKNIRPREDVTLTKLGVKIPNNSNSYNDFKAEMQKNENEFKGSIELDLEKLAVS